MLVAKRYRLGPSIGRGGMGEVFRATDEQLGRLVAVKLLLPSDHAERAAERFQREARAAARLSDPHVVSVYDFGSHGDGFFLVMELVEGRSLAEELAELGPLPKDRAIDLIEQAAAGLAAAHREDVVHRDVKPGNLLLTTDGTVKVADFGIAHLPGDGTTTLTATGQIIGSTHYLSPERARGGQAGKAADVYALGCVLYQLVTGHPPFTADHPAAILYQHVDTAPAPPSLVRPELSGPFESVLLQMLAKEPADRPSAAEIAAGSLRAQHLAPAAAALDVEPGDGESLPEPPNRMRGKALVAGAIAVLATAAAVLAGVLLNGNEPRLPPTTDVGPQPSGTSSAPASTPAATSTASTTGPPQTRTNPTTTQPTQSPSQQPTQSPSPTSTGTTSPSASPQSSTTPSAPTSGTPSTTPSSPPPTVTSTPVTGTPSPGGQGTGTPPPAD
ncbi:MULTISPECIES: serine/threonine-protein kinase [unclassified Kribbella]|uniref:serine/threonine-protein kinase n=1 Tax=unclassified Kribbella TaxID=2644121 RepID=UPI003076B1FA